MYFNTYTYYFTYCILKANIPTLKYYLLIIKVFTFYYVTISAYYLGV